MVFLAVFIAFISILLSLVLFLLTNEKMKKLESKASHFEIELFYSSIKKKREELDEVLSEFGSLYQTVIRESDNEEFDLEYSTSKLTLLYFRTKQKYSNLYQEIEKFCEKFNDTAIVNQGYLKKEIGPTIIKDALKQAQVFGLLNDCAGDLELERIPRPSATTFQQFEVFINRFSSVDFLAELSQARNKNSFNL